MTRALIIAARQRMPTFPAVWCFLVFAVPDLGAAATWYALAPRLIAVALLFDGWTLWGPSQRRSAALGVKWGLIVTAFFVLLGGADDWMAARAAPAADPLVIRDDAGGRVDWRGAEIRELYATGERVELRGECMSACTMYLALPNVCVAANATFGFHGPSFYGLPLNGHDFEVWSQYIAAHYPPAIAKWYLEDARFTTHRTRRILGAELIRIGIQECKGD